MRIYAHPRETGLVCCPFTTSDPEILIYFCFLRPGAARFGYLYDVDIEVLPTLNSSIIEVLGSIPSPTYVTDYPPFHSAPPRDTQDAKMPRRTLIPGARLLLLVHVRLDVHRPSQTTRSGHQRQKSEDLIDDLELQLGNTATEYLQIRLTYCHSGFPQQDANSARNIPSPRGTSVRTRLETVATAAIKRHNVESGWSPLPAPWNNPLLEIISSHWGLAAAGDIMEKLAAAKPPTPRKSARLPAPKEPQQISQKADTANSPTPQTQQTPDRNRGGGQKSPSPRARGTGDPARKIWSEMRRISSARQPATHHVTRVQRIPSSSTCPATTGEETRAPSPGCMVRPARSTRYTADKQRPVIRDKANRNRRPVGAETLRSLVPSTGEIGPAFAMDGKAEDRRSDRSVESQSIKGKRDSGKWSWGTWWQ